MLKKLLKHNINMKAAAVTTLIHPVNTHDKIPALRHAREDQYIALPFNKPVWNLNETFTTYSCNFFSSMFSLFL